MKAKLCTNSEHLGDLIGDEEIGNRTKEVSFSDLLQKDLSWVVAKGETVSTQPCHVIPILWETAVELMRQFVCHHVLYSWNINSLPIHLEIYEPVDNLPCYLTKLRRLGSP